MKCRPKILLVAIMFFVLMFSCVGPVFAGGGIQRSVNSEPFFTASAYYQDGVIMVFTEDCFFVDHLKIFDANGNFVASMNQMPTGFMYGIKNVQDGEHIIKMVAYSSPDETTAITSTKSFAINIKNGVNDYSKTTVPMFNVDVKVSGKSATIKLSGVQGPINHVKVKDKTGRDIGSMVFNGTDWSLTKQDLAVGNYTWYVYAFSALTETQNTMGIKWVDFSIIGSSTNLIPIYLPMIWSEGESMVLELKNCINVDHVNVDLIINQNDPNSPQKIVNWMSLRPVGTDNATARLKWPEKKYQASQLLVTAFSTQGDDKMSSKSFYVNYTCAGLPIDYIKPVMNTELTLVNGEYVLHVTGQNITRLLLYNNFGERVGNISKVNQGFTVNGLPQIPGTRLIIYAISDNGTLTSDLPMDSYTMKSVYIPK